jgi:hypothetical protein
MTDIYHTNHLDRATRTQSTTHPTRNRKSGRCQNRANVFVFLFVIATSFGQPAFSGSLSSGDQQRLVMLRAQRQSAEDELKTNLAAQNTQGTSDQQRAALLDRAKQLRNQIDKSSKEEQQILTK